MQLGCYASIANGAVNAVKAYTRSNTLYSDKFVSLSRIRNVRMEKRLDDSPFHLSGAHYI